MTGPWSDSIDRGAPGGVAGRGLVRLAIAAALLAGLFAGDRAAAQGVSAGQDAPGVSSALAAQTGIATNRRFRYLFSCPEFTGDDALMVEAECLWLRTAGGGLGMTEKDGITGYDDGNASGALGGQLSLAEDWVLGLAFSYDHDWLSANDGTVDSRADSAFLGASLKWQFNEHALFSVELGGSYAWVDNDRHIQTGGGTLTAKSNPNFWSGAARIHMQYEFLLDRYYILPFQDFNFVYTKTPSYSESGAGGLDLDVQSADQWGFSSNKGVEFGARLHVASGFDLRTFTYVGVTIANNQDWTSFASSPAGGDVFSIIPVDKYYGRVGAGLQLYGDEGLDLRLDYDGGFSGHTSSHVGALRVGYRF